MLFSTSATYRVFQVLAITEFKKKYCLVILFPFEIVDKIKGPVQHHQFTNITRNCNMNQLLEQLVLQSL